MGAHRVTGNRGRSGRGRNDTRGQGRGNGEVDPEEENDAQGSDEEQEDDDAGQCDGVLTFGRAQRSTCDGDYKKKPQLGQPKLGVITFINGKNIKEARYKKTIRVIVRNNWEFETTKEEGRARECFLKKCIHKFKELEKKLEKPPTLLEMFDVSYKKKGKVEEIGRKLKEVVEHATEKGNSQDAPLSLANQRKHDVELLLKVCPLKKGKFKMFPRHTLTELVGIDEVSKYTSSQSSLVCIPERIPKSAYSIIGKVLTDVTNMVEAIEEIEVTCAKLDEEVQKLAARAYPNRDNVASKILWEEYIQIASHMTSPLYPTCSFLDEKFPQAAMS
ncbi:hypothetical protein AgCh_019693 [Apium graveolens]